MEDEIITNHDFPIVSVPRMTFKQHLVVRLQSWRLVNVQYPFIGIIPRSTLKGNESLCSGLFYWSNRAVQYFIKDYYYRFEPDR